MDTANANVGVLFCVTHELCVVERFEQPAERTERAASPTSVRRRDAGEFVFMG
jgi:hypothetical protein